MNKAKIVTAIKLLLKEPLTLRQLLLLREINDALSEPEMTEKEVIAWEKENRI